MLYSSLLFLGLVGIGSSAPSDITPELYRGGHGSGGNGSGDVDTICPTEGGCCGKPPLGFPWERCPAQARLYGTVDLSGDVDYGKMTIDIRSVVQNACGDEEPADERTIDGGRPCRRAELSFRDFDIERIFFKKGHTTVDQKNPMTTPLCADCTTILTYPQNPDCPHPPCPGPPEPKEVCTINTNVIVGLDISKSMHFLPNARNDVLKMVTDFSRRWFLGRESSRFALTTFSDDSRISWDLNSKIAQDSTKVRIGVASTKFSNKFSNHASAIDSAVQQFGGEEPSPKPSVFVLFADGKPNKDVRRIEYAVKNLRRKNICFSIVGVRVAPGSEEDCFFRDILGCGPEPSVCPALTLVNTANAEASIKAIDDVTAFVCKCAGKCQRELESGETNKTITTFTVRIDDRTLNDLGTRSQVNATVDEMLWNVAEATGVTPERLQAIAIEDTLGNTIGAMDNPANMRKMTQGQSGPSATLIEVLFDEPGLNIEPKSLEATRRLSTLLKENEGTLKERLAERGLGQARIERIAIRQNDAEMRVLDIIQQ